MQIEDTDLPGVRLIRPEASADERGSFARLYCPLEFAAAGIDFTPVQVNISRNIARHTLRGLHYQDPPRGEAKLVHVTCGAIWDVAVDVRAESATRGRWTAVRLDADSLSALFIPEGFAHGFMTLEPNTDILYHMGRLHEPGWERGIRWDDPSLGIDWPAEPEVMSQRDAIWPAFEG